MRMKSFALGKLLNLFLQHLPIPQETHDRVSQTRPRLLAFLFFWRRQRESTVFCAALSEPIPSSHQPDRRGEVWLAPAREIDPFPTSSATTDRHVRPFW